MFQGSEIFEKHYEDYCKQIAELNLESIQDILGIEVKNGKAAIPFLYENYTVSGEGIEDSARQRPSYTLCVVLAKYLLLCPDQLHLDTTWASVTDFKKNSYSTNVNFFASGTIQAILKPFSGRAAALAEAGERLGGQLHDAGMSYDVSMAFEVLPRISLLLLFNDADDDFPAQCSVLFHKHSENYLDPESLLIASATLAKSLEKADTGKAS